MELASRLRDSTTDLSFTTMGLAVLDSKPRGESIALHLFRMSLTKLQGDGAVRCGSCHAASSSLIHVAIDVRDTAGIFRKAPDQ